MLSFKSSNSKGENRPIAIIKGGKYNNKILYLDITTNESNDDIGNLNPSEILEDVYEDINKSKLTIKQMKELNRLLKRNEPIPSDLIKSDRDLYDIVKNIRDKSNKIGKKEFKIHDDGIIQPLPRFDKTERCYIAGQTECGKSYYIGHYLEQLIKVFPNKKIFVFSDVEQDPEIDDIFKGKKNMIRFSLDVELLDKDPIKPETFKDSICVFDDIDSIQNVKLLKYVQSLRDSLLRRGRHENISVLITSHLLTNYKDTRIILNECNNIVLFCRSGSSYGIKYLLQKYIGLNKNQINKVLSLPSRWVSINKNANQFILYEKGAFIL